MILSIRTLIAVALLLAPIFVLLGPVRFTWPRRRDYPIQWDAEASSWDRDRLCDERFNFFAGWFCIAYIVAAMVLLATVAHAHPRHHRFVGYDSGEIVSHPAGCPWNLFCGCGAAERAFGHFVPQSSGLWLASSWLAFPRAAPGPGMAAVWSGHVAIIESYEGGDVAVLYDANSGGHLTRIHRASIAGARIVNPHGGKAYASALWH